MMETSWIKSEGAIVYDPPRDTMKRNTKNWCIVQTSRGITGLYRWFLDRNWWEVEKNNVKRGYFEPAFPGHISIIRGEQLRQNAEDWNKIFKKKVAFEYANDIRMTTQDEKFYYIPVRFPEYNEIRKHFGLLTHDPRNGKEFTGHITIAKTYG